MTETARPHPTDPKHSNTPEKANDDALSSLTERRATHRPPRKPRQHPNKQMQISGKLLLEHGAMAVTEAHETINERLSTIGYPTGGDASSRTTANPSPSETAALVATQQLAHRKNLRDAVNNVETSIQLLVNLALHITNKPRPGTQGHKLCAEHQMGRQGADVWGDPKCTALPVRSGLCEREAKAESRWRRDNGHTGREEPAA